MPTPLGTGDPIALAVPLEDLAPPLGSLVMKLITSSGEFHQRQRRLMQPLFQRKYLMKLNEPMLQSINILLTRWTRLAPGPVLLQDEMFAVALRIIGAVVCSSDLTEQTHPIAAFFSPLVRTMSAQASQQATQQFYQAMRALIQERRLHPGLSEDLLDLLVRAHDPRDHMSVLGSRWLSWRCPWSWLALLNGFVCVYRQAFHLSNHSSLRSIFIHIPLRRFCFTSEKARKAQVGGLPLDCRERSREKGIDRKRKRAREEMKVTPAGSFCWNEKCHDSGTFLGRGGREAHDQTQKKSATSPVLDVKRISGLMSDFRTHPRPPSGRSATRILCNRKEGEGDSYDQDARTSHSTLCYSAEIPPGRVDCSCSSGGGHP